MYILSAIGETNEIEPKNKLLAEFIEIHESIIQIHRHIEHAHINR